MADGFRWREEGEDATLTLVKECYAMKLDLMSNATVVDRTIKFVDNHRGLMPQKSELGSGGMYWNICS
jgi:hypothetical protein